MLWLIHTYRKFDPGGIRRHETQRAAKTQYLCGGAVRLQRGRAHPLSNELFQKFEAELLDLARRGFIEIRVDSPVGPLLPDLDRLAQEKSSVPPTPQRPQVPAQRPVEVLPTVWDVPEELVAAAVPTPTPPEPPAEEEPVSEESDQATDQATDQAEGEKSETVYLSQMTKGQLATFVAERTGKDPEELQAHTRKFLLEAAKRLASS